MLLYDADKLTDNFLLFVDPLMKAMYQIDLTMITIGKQEVRGIDMRTSNMPTRVAFDLTTHHFYWHDNEFDGRNSVKRMSLDGDVSEHSLTVLSHGNNNVVITVYNDYDIIIVHCEPEKYVPIYSRL